MAVEGASDHQGALASTLISRELRAAATTGKTSSGKNSTLGWKEVGKEPQPAKAD